MIGFRDNIQAININQADAAFGMVAVADINHRAPHRAERMSPLCLGKRRRLSKRPYSPPTVPVHPGLGRGGSTGLATGTTTTPWRSSWSGGPAATLWATLVIQRALSS